MHKIENKYIKILTKYWNLAINMMFKVCAVSDNTDAFNNTVYVNNSEYDNCYLDLFGYNLLIKSSKRYDIGFIGMNRAQKEFFALAHNTEIICKINKKIDMPTIIGKINFIISMLGQKTSTVIDSDDFVLELKEKFTNIPIIQNMGYYMQYNGFYFQLKPVSETGNNAFLDETTAIDIISVDDCIVVKGSVEQLFKTSFNFKELGIGGLDEEFEIIFRRAFASRLLPEKTTDDLGIKHVKGILLYGLPGCGKSIIATKIGETLNCEKPEIVSGPSLLSGLVGSSEENVRKLFANAIKGKGNGKLYLIICDEFDSLCKKRGMNSGDAGVGDRVVNQFLSMIDGPESLNNVLFIATTNRKDLIDDAILRPGRLEVHINIGLPDLLGRNDILDIHTRKMKSKGYLDNDVNLCEISSLTPNYTGAELESVVKTAVSYAISREMDISNLNSINTKNIKPHVSQKDFITATKEIIPMFGSKSKYIDIITAEKFIFWSEILKHCYYYVLEKIGNLKKGNLLSFLVTGEKKCGKTKFASHIANDSNISCVKFVNSEVLMPITSKSLELYNIFSQCTEADTSILILDSIENLIEYSPIGGLYNNHVLQALYTILDKKLEKTNKMVILLTSSNYDLMGRLGITEIVDETIIIDDSITNDVSEFLIKELKYAVTTEKSVAEVFKKLKC